MGIAEQVRGMDYLDVGFAVHTASHFSIASFSLSATFRSVPQILRSIKRISGYDRRLGNTLREQLLAVLYVVNEDTGKHHVHDIRLCAQPSFVAGRPLATRPPHP